MGIKIYQVDAFTSEPYRGNPAAVCILPELNDDLWMQNVALEMNLSETAFLSKRADGYNLRWFTPEVEVELCGHATLASSHILWETGLLQPEADAHFHTLSGVLTAKRTGNTIELNFPATPPVQVTSAIPEITEALHIIPEYVGKTKFDYIVRVQSENEVRALQPDFVRLKELGLRGVMVTSFSDSKQYDFVSRFFAPGAGIDEDPVTGSAHCCLGPYWSTQLGKKTLKAYQASARGGEIGIQIEGDRVKLTGSAVTVLKGELLP